MPNILTKIESERGCGYRKKGGVYLVSDGVSSTCYRLPIKLTVCPCCDQGIKPTRGFMWIKQTLLLSDPCKNKVEGHDDELNCVGCPLGLADVESLGLMWVGGKFYTPESFSIEAARRGVSKRIAQIPRELKIGETWVALGHRKAIFEVEGKKVSELTTDELSIEMKKESNYKAGVFMLFKPKRIEYIVRGDEETEFLERLEKRGVTLVNVIRDIDAKTEMEFNDKDTN